MKRAILASLVLLWSAWVINPAQASTELREKLTRAAEQILENTHQDPVSVGFFTATRLEKTNTGPGIEELLKTELELKQKGSVKKDAKFEIKGDYALTLNKSDPSLKEIKITIRIIQADTSDELTQLRVEVTLDGNRTIAEVLQVTAAIEPDGTKKERNKEIIKQAENPTVFIHGDKNTLISSTKASPYDVEILVKPLKDHAKQTAKPRAAKDADGLAYVEINREELYEVKVANRSGRETAVAVSIDGIDMFHFSNDKNDRGEPQFSHFILPPKGTPGAELPIVGWHKSVSGKDNFLSFLVTEYGKGAASQEEKKTGLSAEGKVGVIHVQFAHCKPLPEGAKSAPGNETGFGPPREVKQKPVQYEIDPPHDFVTIRYTRPLDLP